MRMTLCVEWWLTDDGLAPMADSFRSANFVKTEIFHNARPGYCVINGSSTISTASSCLAKPRCSLMSSTFSDVFALYFCIASSFVVFTMTLEISNCRPYYTSWKKLDQGPLVHLCFTKTSDIWLSHYEKGCSISRNWMQYFTNRTGSKTDVIQEVGTVGVPQIIIIIIVMIKSGEQSSW